MARIKFEESQNILLWRVSKASKMKFRARLRKESVMTIHSVTTTLGRIGQTAAIFLNEECIRVAVITDSTDAPKCYSELDPKVLLPPFSLISQLFSIDSAFPSPLPDPPMTCNLPNKTAIILIDSSPNQLLLSLILLHLHM